MSTNKYTAMFANLLDIVCTKRYNKDVEAKTVATCL